MSRNTAGLFLLMALVFLAFGVCLFAADGSSAPVPLRRFALVAGSNNGGPGKVRLKYATSDAIAFASVMADLGGVKDADMILLVDPDLVSFKDGLRKVRRMVGESPGSDERRELIIYYSGHSDETGLILGPEILSYDELRRQIGEVKADVRVAVLDSCASGALTRTKGGVWRPAFLLDASSDMKGHAFLTSSSAEESAQESDRIGASFFTHYLISGLRGAADVTGDGLVTLNEAYAFAFQETLASTEKTQYGPQHPAYDINLTGSGDLVLTDLRNASAGLAVSEDVSGRMYVRDERGLLAVELNKLAGQRVDLGLEPGVYEVVLDRKDARYRSGARIIAGSRATLAFADFKAFTVDRTVPRGDDGAEIGNTGGGDEGEKRNVPDGVHFSFLPEVFGGLFASTTDRTVSFNLLIGSSANLNGFELGGLANTEAQTMSGFQAAGLANLVRGRVNGVQLAGLGNMGGETRYFQGAGILNYVTGSFEGYQSSGVGNVVMEGTSGAQTAGIFNYDRGDVTGVSVAGITTLIYGGLNGVQVSACYNMTMEDSVGAQVTGGFNYSRTFFTGVQFGGIGNYSRELSGVQIGIVNISDSVNGAQIGLVNIAGYVKGTQVGLFNYSRLMDGIPVGLITYEEAGLQVLETWYDTENALNVGIKLGSRYVYTLLAASFVPDSDPLEWSYGIGFGAHVPFGSFFLDADLACHSLHEGSSEWYVTRRGNVLGQARLTVGIPIFRFAVIAGVAADIYVPNLSTESDGTRTEHTHLLPRLFCGIQI